MNHEVVNSNQHQDNGDMNHDVEDSTHQQPLSGDSGMDHDGKEVKWVDSDLPFSGLDDDSLVEEMRDLYSRVNLQYKMMITTKLKKFIER